MFKRRADRNFVGLVPARVVDIVLNKEDPLSEKMGKIPGGSFDTIGNIQFSFLDKTTQTGESDELMPTYAKPLSSYVKYYPVIGEVVLLINTVSKEIYKSKSNTHWYYLPSPINIWKNAQHSSLPKESKSATLAKAPIQLYQEAEGGITPSSEENPLDMLDIYQGKFFIEKNTIKNLLAYEGDLILEGRWGNSIRMGSTIDNKHIPNKTLKSPWSEEGNLGDPITIISNGLPDDPLYYKNNSIEDDAIDSPWIHTVENINLDPSSIYLTSNQKISNFTPAGVGNPSFRAGLQEEKTETQQQLEGTNYITTPALNNDILPISDEEDVIMNPPIMVTNKKEDLIVKSDLSLFDGNEKTPFYIVEKTTDTNLLSYYDFENLIIPNNDSLNADLANARELDLEEKIGDYFRIKHLIYTPKSNDLEFQETSNNHPDALFERENVGFYVEINDKGVKTIHIKEYIGSTDITYRTLAKYPQINPITSVAPFQYNKEESELIKEAEIYVFGNHSYYGINNYPGIDPGITQGEILQNLTDLVTNIIDPIIQGGLGNLKLISAYRSKRLNNKLKGNPPNSEHIYGYAADISVGTGNNQGLYNYIYNNLEFKNLMWAYPEKKDKSWIHVSYIKDQNHKKTTLLSEMEAYHKMYKGVRRGKNKNYQDNITEAITPPNI